MIDNWYTDKQALQGIECPLGAGLLPERERAVDDDHAQDRRAQRGHALPRLVMLCNERQRRRQPQDQREEMRHLPRRAAPQWFPRRGFHFVDTEAGETPRGLSLAQTLRCRIEAGQRFIDRQRMQVHRQVTDP